MRPVESLFFVVAEIWFWCGHINKLLLLEIQYSPNMGDSRCRPVGAIRSIAIRSSGRHCDLVHAQVCPAPCIATFRSASSCDTLRCICCSSSFAKGPCRAQSAPFLGKATGGAQSAYPTCLRVNLQIVLLITSAASVPVRLPLSMTVAAQTTRWWQ